MKVSKISKKVLHENIAGYLFASPWLIGFLVFVLSPIISSFYLSFTRYDILRSPRWIGLDNYINIFTYDELFWKALYNTLYYTVFSVPLAVFGSLMLAILLNHKLKGVGIFRTVFYLPSVTSGVAMALLWIWIFDPGIGIANTILRFFGIRGPLWFWDDAWSKPTMVIVSLVAIGGTRCLTFLAGLQGLPQEMYEAADIDGANWWVKFKNVTVPLLSPVILFNVIISIINSFKVFTNAYVITEGGPLNSTLFFVLYLYRNAFTWLKMGYASALAWIFFLVVLSFSMIQLYMSKRWVHYESDVKR